MVGSVQGMHVLLYGTSIWYMDCEGDLLVANGAAFIVIGREGAEQGKYL